MFLKNHFQTLRGATGTSFCRILECDKALEPPRSILLSYVYPKVWAHIRHIACTHKAHAKKWDFWNFDFSRISRDLRMYVLCAWCVQILQVHSNFWKTKSTVQELSSGAVRSFVRQILAHIGPHKVCWKVEKCHFWRIIENSQNQRTTFFPRFAFFRTKSKKNAL